MRIRLPLVLVFLALLPGLAPAQEPAGFKVIVNTANAMNTIGASDLSRLFLKKDVEWPDGSPVVAVDLPPDSPVREAFSMAIHDRKVSSIKSYWQRQIFAGKAVPPTERENEAEVLVFVSRNSDAVGYVGASFPLIDNVKVLKVTD
jgi:ABC-type phosphate transport system substrate-binding protein